MQITNVTVAVVAFAITASLGFWAVPFLKKLKFGQTIREEGPSWHEKKSGTPTMGGIMMIVGFIVSVAVIALVGSAISNNVNDELKNSQHLTRFVCGIALAVGMGLVGFLDDYIKVVKKRNLGLTAKQKTFFQLIISAGYLVSLYFGGMDTVYLPFGIGNIGITSGAGLIFWPVALVFIYFLINAVNLTDGIDGLCSSVTLVAACAFMIGGGMLYMQLGSAISAAIAGVCAGFLMWNAHPAKVFMGDTGSLFLGGAIVAASFCVNRPIWLLPIGIIYIIEALSVVLQVSSFKLTGKRIFKMSPIHHHFEMCGWSEEKIVFIFTVVTLLGSLAVIIPVIINQ